MSDSVPSKSNSTCLMKPRSMFGLMISMPAPMNRDGGLLTSIAMPSSFDPIRS